MQCRTLRLEAERAASTLSLRATIDQDQMLKKFAQCLGLASLVLLENYDDFLAGGGKARMHVPFALGGIAWANILDIFLLTAVLFAILAPLKRTRLYPVARLLLVIAIPLYFLGRLDALLPFALPQLFAPIFTFAWPAALLILFLRFPSWYRRAMVFGSRLGAAFAIFAVFSIAQLLAITTWKPGPHQHSAAWAETPQPPRQHPRLVWILFDELSYDQLFEHRAHDLPLPNFDALRSISTLYTNTQPIGYHTVSIVPSLIGGQVIDDYRFRWNNQLDLHFPGVRGWRQATGATSVFGDAQQLGWRTAVVGWYNPYCTVYASAIDDCYWMNWDKIEGPMAQDKTLWHNTWIPLAQIERRATSSGRAAHFLCNYDVNQRLKTHLDLEKHALRVLQTDQADMIYFHLSIPHSPNIWSRIDNTYTTTCDSSYLDNLALADIEVGKIMTLLKASPRWQDTTMIVQGDHSWRVELWDSLPAWTDEDDAASRNIFDPRPAVIIHQPGETTPQTDASPWSILNIHQVIEQVLHTQSR
jgi:hypothetical protein